MGAIVESIEISRRPGEVFSYVTEPSRLPEWQESVVAVRRRAMPLSPWAREPS